MHKLNVQILGPSSFISTLNELKMFLKFNPIFDKLDDNPILILFHIDALSDKEQKNYIDTSNCIKICAGNKNKLLGGFDASLELPSTLKEINIAVENAVAKNKFNKNSAIEIKGYLLNKNEKKLSKSDQFIILTEKEIQLLELFLNIKKPISKNKILSSVWKYATDADTHTVETHIYRLRKKIFDKFIDEKFILNNKDGYYF
ncbi:winged helix-turn-helix domain-containing protein [Candidatus Pelagibacter bacterium]|nr:winged helix-turn-helix domain-containing protein [Candidatus Pelagibacter bacterium]